MDAIAGKPINAVFNVRLDDVFSQASGYPGQPTPLRDAERGRRFFSTCQPPCATNQSRPAGAARAPRSRRP